jgi:hypothetical protein
MSSANAASQTASREQGSDKAGNREQGSDKGTGGSREQGRHRHRQRSQEHQLGLYFSAVQLFNCKHCTALECAGLWCGHCLRAIISSFYPSAAD